MTRRELRALLREAGVARLPNAQPTHAQALLPHGEPLPALDDLALECGLPINQSSEIIQ